MNSAPPNGVASSAPKESPLVNRRGVAKFEPVPQQEDPAGYSGHMGGMSGRSARSKRMSPIKDNNGDQQTQSNQTNDNYNMNDPPGDASNDTERIRIRPLNPRDRVETIRYLGQRILDVERNAHELLSSISEIKDLIRQLQS